MRHVKRCNTIVVAVFALVIAVGLAVAQDPVHAISGIVKSVDKNSKTMVVKLADGTEQTIKYSEKTSVGAVKGAGEGGTEAYLAGKEGAKVTVKYTEEAGQKTAVGVKDAGKAVGRNVPQ